VRQLLTYKTNDRCRRRYSVLIQGRRNVYFVSDGVIEIKRFGHVVDPVRYEVRRTLPACPHLVLENGTGSTVFLNF
jgi:hypothetical protein